MPDLGRLIAFEGGEGAGKSTQSRALASHIGAELTREPGGTPLGERLRRLLLEETGPLDPRAELMLLLAARAEHLAERIGPALAAGRHVVVDRFTASTLAYQGYGRGLPIEEVRRACALATGGREPDLTVLLDVPVPLGAARRSPRSEDRIEREEAEFHERVRRGFLAEAAAAPERWLVVDGSLAEAEVGASVKSGVAARLGILPKAAG